MIQISPTKTIHKPSRSYKQDPSQCESDMERYSASYTGGDHPSRTSPPYAGHDGLFSDIQSIGHPQSVQGLQCSATSCTVPELSPNYGPVIIPTNYALHSGSSSENVLPSHFLRSAFTVRPPIKTGLNCNQNRSTSSLLPRWLARCLALFDTEHIRTPLTVMRSFIFASTWPIPANHES